MLQKLILNSVCFRSLMVQSILIVEFLVRGTNS